MALYVILRSLSHSSFHLNHRETPILSLYLLPRLLSATTAITSSSSSAAAAATAAHYCHLLRTNSSHPNLERSLSQSRTKLDPSVVELVLRRIPPSSSATDRMLALRFFVWAGLHSNYRHSTASYSSACDSLRIPYHPQILDHLLEVYRADGSDVSLKTFKILLNLCRAAGLPGEALSILRRMPEFGCRPDNPSYNAVVRLLVDSGRGGDGAALLNEMAEAGLSPDMVTYTSVVKGLCAEGRLESARELVAQMRASGCVPNVVVYSALIDGACCCSDLDAAVEILEEMEGGSAPNVVSYTCLIKCLCEKGRSVEALEVFDRMGLRGCSPNRVTLYTLVDGFCKEGRIGDAFELVERVVKEGRVPSGECYSLFVVSLLRIGKQVEAEEIVERMLAKGVRPDGSACNSLLRELCSQRRFLDGHRWLCELEEKGLTCIDFDVYSLLLAGLCKDGRLVEAVMLGRKIVEKGILVEATCIDGVVEVLKMNDQGDLASQILRIRGS